MFLRKDLNDLLEEYNESPKDKENFLIIEQALLILNRCLNF